MTRLTALLALLFAATACADHWPAWRGSAGQGHSSEKDLPVKWDTKQNVRWKVKLPDSGCSTPVVWGERIFLTQASDKTTWPPKGGNGGQAVAKKRSLMCLKRSDGSVIWQKDVIYDELEATHPTNPFCAASPATDGKIVVVSHGSAGMYAYDLEGKELWKVDTGKQEHVWGNASSPVLHGDLVILWIGPGKRQILLAVNRKDGKEVWRHEEPGGASGLGDDKKWVGSWSTPVIAKVNGEEQLILGVPKKLKGFSVKDGKERWHCDGLGDLVYSSPLVSDGMAVAMSGYGGPALAVKLGGTGDITKDRLWHHTKGNPQRIGTGVIVGKHMFRLEESGAPRCFEVATGNEVWQKQTEKRPAGGSWSSMVVAGGKLYNLCRGGETVVLNADPDKYEVLAVNRLGEHTDASLAVSDGELFIRTYRHLWCIGKK